MAPETVDAVFVIPFANNEMPQLRDTLGSVDRWVTEPHRVIAVDDCTRERLDETLRRERPDVTVMRNPRPHGGRSGLYVTLASAAKLALDRFDFRVLVKMDTDALMVGPGLVRQAIRAFEEHPDVGLLGSYHVRADGERREWGKWKMAFWYESFPLRPLWRRTALWREPIGKARRRPYDLGENVLGGAYILSRACLEAMRRDGWLDYRHETILRESRIGEDVIMSLLCKASGYDLLDFGTPSHSMALALADLPLPKEEILRTGKTIVHSVKRGHDGESQEELRAYFRAHRDDATIP
jgi:glycosyltransferase involved in cell wall biosynthesis